MILLSVTGLVRTLLIIFGVIFLLRIFGKMAQTRRMQAENEALKREAESTKAMVEKAKQNYGKTSISNSKQSISDDEFTDFEEVD